MKPLRIALLVLLLASPLARATVLPPEPVAHPRLLLPVEKEQEIRDAIKLSPLLQQADSIILSECDRMLSTPVLERRLTGRRLSVSSEAIRRIFYLSFVYRIHGGEAYRQRALDEMKAVCLFSDWNPDHFLDTAEMAMAVGFGYDWLYSTLTPQEKEFFSNAVVEKAFNPTKDDQIAWFYTSGINWNQVCNCGLLYAALAIMDEQPGESSRIVAKALETNPLPLKECYSPEGCYAEGYGYWGYGTSFEIMLIAALESAYGTDCGLLEVNEGFLRSGTFMKMMKTPSFHCYNYYDSAPSTSFQYPLTWIAARTGDYTILRGEIDQLRKQGLRRGYERRFLPFFIISASALRDENGLPLDLDSVPVPYEKFYESSGTTPLLIYRSGWTSPDDTFFAVKGGKPAFSHAHVDMASFYLESDGIRWAADLGSQNYNSLESKGYDIWNLRQDSDRWKIFRIGPFSHNIININSHTPDVDVHVALDSTWKTDSRKGASFDLGLFYQKDLSYYRRDVWLDEEDDLHTLDSLVSREGPCMVEWRMCTEAQGRLENGKVLLTKNGHLRILHMTALDEKGRSVRIEPFIESATPSNDYDEPNPGFQIVGWRLPLKAGKGVKVETILDKIE